MSTTLDAALRDIGRLSAELIAQCKNRDDAMAVAIALMVTAETILREDGGGKHAAAQFRAFADRCAQSDA